MVIENDWIDTSRNYYEMDFLGPMSNADKADISWLGSEAFWGELDWKVLVDFWAWAAWFLPSLETDDTQIYEVDPVYASPEQFEKMKQITTVNFWNLVWELMTYRQTEIIQRGIRRYTDLVLQAEQAECTIQNPNVHRCQALGQVPEQVDVIFSSYIFNSLDDTALLDAFSEKLTESWRVIIIDTTSEWIVKFMLRNISSFRGVTIKKNDMKSACITIEKKALKRVCVTLKRYRK